MNKNLRYTVIFEKAEEGGYFAYVPKLPGCFTQGETYEETEKNIIEAIQLYTTTLKEQGEEVPVEMNQITTTTISL